MLIVKSETICIDASVGLFCLRSMYLFCFCMKIKCTYLEKKQEIMVNYSEESGERQHLKETSR